MLTNGSTHMSSYRHYIPLHLPRGGSALAPPFPVLMAGRLRIKIHRQAPASSVACWEDDGGRVPDAAGGVS